MFGLPKFCPKWCLSREKGPSVTETNEKEAKNQQFSFSADFSRFMAYSETKPI